MAGRQGISGTGLAALAGGSLLMWSAIAGRAWTAVLRELIAGKQPGGNVDYPITAQVAATASSAAAAGAQAGISATPPGPGARQVCASTFGGPHDPGTGNHGYHGDNLNGTTAYAELGMGHALGGLPYKQQARITYNGRSVLATKLDIGLGGAGCGGHARALDLWWETANAIGFNGLGVVTFETI